MSTLLVSYVQGIRGAMEAAAGFPAVIEPSPVRAISRKDPMVICVLPGAEAVNASPIGRATRTREIHVVVHTAGDDHLEAAESVFEAAHPLVMTYTADGIVSIAEHSTDEPKYANGDLTRQVVTRRYRITYQTDEHSLSE